MVDSYQIYDDDGYALAAVPECLYPQSTDERFKYAPPAGVTVREGSEGCRHLGPDWDGRFLSNI
jgi:hypothetical protein